MQEAVARLGVLLCSGAIRPTKASDPALPVEIGAFRTYQPFGLDIVGDLVYVADSAAGLLIVDFGPEYRAGITAEIDIRPSSDTNPINPFSRGVIPVAILGSDTFDVEDADLTALAFGPDGASAICRAASHLWDVNDDGFPDLLCHYRTQETGIAIGDTEACVTGKTLDGTPLEGCDIINTQPPGLRCGIGFELAFLAPALMWLKRRRRMLETEPPPGEAESFPAVPSRPPSG